MSQQYNPVTWVDETLDQVGTVINKARLDQMQSAHHYADGFEEVDAVPAADPQVDYHKVVFCTADTTFYRWDGTQWTKDVDDHTLALLEAHEADHNNPHVVTKTQVGLGNVDNYASVSSWQTTPDNTHIPTEKLVKDSLDLKVNASVIVATWQVTPDDTHIPSEKLVKDSLDGKVDKLTTKPTAGTYTKVTINAEGQVTAGANPTTLLGYGITDAVDIGSAQTITGSKTFSALSYFTLAPTIQNTGPEMRFNNTNSLVSADGMAMSLRGYDASHSYAQIDGYRRGSVSLTELHMYTRNASDTVSRLTLYQYDNGTSWAQAPSRTYNASNTNDIVTIGSLQASSDVVHTTGNEIVGGIKTFTDNPRIRNANHQITVSESSGTNATMMVTKSENGTYEGRLNLTVLNDGTITLYLEKWVNGSWNNSTTVATL